MANQKKDRVPSETLAHLSMPEPPGGARTSAIGVVLWTSPSRRLDCRSTKSNSPLLILVLDVIRSCGGLPAAENSQTVEASFPDPQTALLCAQRIQWAIEGLAEYEPFKGAVSTVGVDFTGAPGGGTFQNWSQFRNGEGIDPRNILLGRNAAEFFGELPGIALESTAVEGWQRWSWKATPPAASFAADDLGVLEMIQAAGRIDPFAPQRLSSTTVSNSAVSSRSDSQAAGAALRSNDPPLHESPSRSGKIPMIPVIIGSVAVIAIVIAAILFFGHKAPVQSAAPAQSSAPSPLPASQQTQSAPPQPHPKQPAAKDSSSTKKPAKVDSIPEPKPSEEHCDLTPEDVQRSLDRAERYMHDGNLPSATAAFKHVMGCPTAREKAQQGLIRIQRMAASN